MGTLASMKLTVFLSDPSNSFWSLILRQIWVQMVEIINELMPEVVDSFQQIYECVSLTVPVGFLQEGQ